MGHFYACLLVLGRFNSREGLILAKKWGPRNNETPLPVYYMLTLDSNNSKQNRRHNVHKHLAAVLCIRINESGRYEEQPQPLLGSPLGGFLKGNPSCSCRPR